MLVVLTTAPAFAQQGMSQDRMPLMPGSGGILEGTPQEQAACAADAHRYCRDDIPDTLRVLGCLKTERSRISKPCQQVLINHGQ
jgi:hypothetical protein